MLLCFVQIVATNSEAMFCTSCGTPNPKKTNSQAAVTQDKPVTEATLDKIKVEINLVMFKLRLSLVKFKLRLSLFQIMLILKAIPQKSPRS